MQSTRRKMSSKARIDEKKDELKDAIDKKKSVAEDMAYETQEEAPKDSEGLEDDAKNAIDEKKSDRKD